MTRTFADCIALITALTLCCTWSAGCGSCSKRRADLPLAKMLELRGENAQRDHNKTREHWEPASVSSEFWLGDGFRTDPPSSALLAFADGAQLHVRTGTEIRFLVDGARDGEDGIDVITGEALLDTGNSEVQLRTHVGLATLTAGTRVLLTREAEDLRLRVELGEARFKNSQGDDVKLGAGQDVLLDLGMAVMHDKPATATTTAATVATPPSAAIVATIRQDGVRERPPGEHTWRALVRGDHRLPAGTGLRVPAGVSVELARGADRAQLRGEGEYVIGDGTSWVDAQRGKLQITARAQDIQVLVPGGRIVVRAADGGSDVGLRIDDSAGALDVQRGKVTFQGSDPKHETHDVSSGDAYHWSFAQPTAAAEPSADAEQGPNYSNFDIHAGESFVVHTPELPVAISVDFSQKCKGAGSVELAQNKQRIRGEGRANIFVPVGVRGYAVRCADANGALGAVIARGTAQVLHDPGTRKLPPKAPTTEIDADGRSYTIFYQNQLPNVRLHWPNPPTVASYVLVLDGTRMSVSTPEHLFQSGSLRDGVHRLSFEAQGRKSRTVNVTVRFDNTAATASLTTPVDGGFHPGDTVSIDGVALPAWNVTVEGGTIEKLGDDRFHGQVVTSPEHPDIAVRLVHPRLGTHYYLRRATGSR